MDMKTLNMVRLKSLLLEEKLVRAANRMRCWRRCGILLCSKPRRSMPVYMRLSCGDRLLAAPRGNFLYEQKVTKESFKRRGFRVPRLLKTSTLEPAQRNRARFPFDSFRGQWTDTDCSYTT